MSFRRRLTLFSAAGIALVLVVGSVATYLIVRNQLRGEIDESLRKQAAAAARMPEEGSGTVETRTDGSPGTGEPTPEGVLSLNTALTGFGDAPIFFQLINGRGAPVNSRGAGSLPVSQRAIQVAKTGTGAYYTDVEVRGTALRMYVRPARPGYAILAARSLTEVDNALNRLGWSLAITCLAGIALAALAGAVVARGALQPVRRLTVTAERITDTHDLGERIETEGDDELSRLGSSFNAMLDSLDSAISSQRQLVSDASHELRTPLTSLRTNIDLLRQGVQLSERDRDRLLRDIGTELEELTTLVTNLVDLARGSQRDLHLSKVRLDDVAEVVVRRAEARFPGLEIGLEVEATTVWGDPEALERAIWNLVENAAKWSNGTGRVDLTVAGGADRPFIFDRFYRSEAARGRPGSGLGLAIVRQIAESHGGRVDVEDAEGGGACFRLVLVPSQPGVGSEDVVASGRSY
jgi:two-component system, OmpR family, sensor histidine kinase MprB